MEATHVNLFKNLFYIDFVFVLLQMIDLVKRETEDGFSLFHSDPSSYLGLSHSYHMAHSMHLSRASCNKRSMITSMPCL